MRILMLTQFYPPTIGGEEHQVRNLSHELAARGHEVAVATFWNDGLPEFELERTVRIYRIRSTVQRADWLFSERARRHAPPFPDPEAVWALQRVIRQEQPEIVHAHNWLLHSFLPLKAWSRAKLVVTLHDYSFACAKKRLMYQGAPCSGPNLGKCLACAGHHYGLGKGVATVFGHQTMGALERATVDMFLPVSHAVAEGNGLVDSRLPYQVIPNFLPDEPGLHQENMDIYLAQLPPEEFLLFVGDLGHEKGLFVLLRAYAELSNAPPLVLIGRAYGDTPAAFPPNVFVYKSWPHAAVLQAWRHSMAALAPSIWPEPFGLVVIEAMMSSRPVIASKTGGVTDLVVDGETGLLVPPGDPTALRQAIERLLADPGLRRCMGQAARRKVTEFQASAVVPRVEQIYTDLLNDRGRLYGQGNGLRGINRESLL